LDPLFATETMAELSARQGRFADAVAIFRHLVRASESTSAAAPDDAARVERWQARIAELEAGSAGASAAALAAPAAPAAAKEPGSPARRGEVTQPPPPANDPLRASLVINEPVRSGQLIYAEGRDLIVVAPVHSGAQLLADGNIHVYGALKGRAVAGTRGARDAQVFCLTLEAELVGVDTGYLTSDDIAPGLWGGPARVCLTPEGLCTVVPLSLGKRAVPAVANPARRIL
jgi:septum site-determining protein MinC